MLHPTPTLKETPSQTAGPYVHIGMTPNLCGITGVIDADAGASMLTPDTRGERITITGRVLDGSGAPVGDAVLEIWQADADGAFAAPMGPNSNSRPAFTGWGRQAAAADGTFVFETIKPGRVEGPDGRPMAPHVSVWIVARGRVPGSAIDAGAWPQCQTTPVSSAASRSTRSTRKAGASAIRCSRSVVSAP